MEDLRDQVPDDPQGDDLLGLQRVLFKPNRVIMEGLIRISLCQAIQAPQQRVLILLHARVEWIVRAEERIHDIRVDQHQDGPNELLEPLLAVDGAYLKDAFKSVGDLVIELVWNFLVDRKELVDQLLDNRDDLMLAN